MKTILVSGASGGIGSKLVEKLLQNNFKVISLGRSHNKDLISRSSRYIPITVDLSDLSKLSHDIDAVDEKILASLDAYVACAG